MIEFLCFTFIIMHTEVVKIKIDMQRAEVNELELRMLIDDVKSDPYKIQKILDTQKNKK